MLNKFWGAQQRPQEGNNESFYPPSVGSSQSPGSSRPGTPSPSSSGNFGVQRPTERASSVSRVSPAEAAGIITAIKDKSLEELRDLLCHQDGYHNLLLSLEPVKTQNKVRDDLRNETLQLASKSGYFFETRGFFIKQIDSESALFAGENLEKEPRIMELRNQCRIIRTTELAAAQEKLHELERRKEELLKFYSPASLLHRLQDAMRKTDEESENLDKQLLEGEIDLATFVHKYKKLRQSYHKRALTHLAAKTSITG
ncbi:hypothetical protein H5410_053665 [Solanum commersonii]|uniref:VPS37 C-terminal domain-containing protein n=1 Tax=Solanum commersonii TaxID=4109 RepID=A0A9J5X716_SOLCO|nr:hypothetical protein H5410_053665 [Solanum commersonii]